jgi:hypothetical protein
VVAVLVQCSIYLLFNSVRPLGGRGREGWRDLKGLSHEIFRPVCWPVWMLLGLNKNRFWFLNFKEAPSI